MKTKEISITGTGANKLPELIKSKFQPEFIKESKSGKSFLFTAESYSFIQESNMAVTIFVEVLSENECEATLLVAGGKKGLFQLDIFSREENRLYDALDSIKEICKEHNLELQEL